MPLQCLIFAPFTCDSVLAALGSDFAGQWPACDLSTTKIINTLLRRDVFNQGTPPAAPSLLSFIALVALQADLGVCAVPTDLTNENPYVALGDGTYVNSNTGSEVVGRKL